MGGFLTQDELAALGERGVEVESDGQSSIAIGPGTVLFPGTFVQAIAGGEIVIGASCELGPGGVQVKANRPGALVRLGDGVRLLNGCEVTGISELGDGAQVIGAVTAQSVRLEGGHGGHAWPDPDERDPGCMCAQGRCST